VWDPEHFHQVISGRKEGISASFLRAMLSAAALPYGVAVSGRNRLFDAGWRPSRRVPVPVISVGNLTLGGTGKTPLVAHLCRELLENGHSPGWISRGYRAKDEQGNDEAKELQRRLPEVPFAMHADRIAAAHQLLREHAVDILVLDDAFQHRRIARELDLVLLDATEPFGHGRLFPRGLLREPLSGLRRADLVFLSRADMVSEKTQRAIAERIRRRAPDVPIVPITHQPQTLVRWQGETSPVESLRGKAVLAFCGLGNPQGFRHTLDRLGARCLAFEVFADHHHYTADDCERLAENAGNSGAEAIVCTVKDLVKIERDALGDLPLQAVEIGIHFPEGDTPLREMISGIFAG
jgi:tetraacyldisaccharide 4'-kinase